jgi:hypothetical protein
VTPGRQGLPKGLAESAIAQTRVTPELAPNPEEPISPNAACKPWHKANHDQLAFREVLDRILAQNRCLTDTSMRSGQTNRLPQCFWFRVSHWCSWVQGLLTIAHHQAAQIRDDATDEL